MIRAIPTIRWGDAGAADKVRKAIAASRAIQVKHMLDGVKCKSVVRAMSDAAEPTNFLAPFKGENIISFARNPWTELTYPPSRLLSEEAGEEGLAQTRLDLLPCFDPRTMLPGKRATQLLGGFKLNREASMIFVTAAGIRTPLHSDERHGMLLHVSGVKNFVVIPNSESDADPATLQELLALRDACGSQSDIYDEESPRTPALLRVRRFQGTLEPGDALFLPQRWLHDIESVTPTISVSLRFGKWDQPN